MKARLAVEWRREVGFTLIELLVVVAVIALLIAILVPALANARERAQRLRCGANFKMLITAVRMYVDEYQDHLPLANWASMDPQRGWLYSNRSQNWDVKLERRNAGYAIGTLWPYTLAAELYRCPRHEDPIPPNPAQYTSAVLTSYLMNGAVVDYDETEYVRKPKKRAHQITDFRVDAVVFWEPPERESGASFNDGSSTPDQWFTERHLGGATVAHVDGHTSWFTHQQWEEALRTVPGPLWCAPGTENGAPGWWDPDE